MRTRIVIFCGIVLAVCLWLLLHRTPEPKTESPEVQAPVTNQPVTSQSAPLPANVAVVPNPTPSQPSSNMMADAVHRGSPEGINEMHERALAHWRVPIDFYGKVIDENSNVVAGVSVSFAWSETPTKEGEQTATTQSDAEGLFSLNGKHGPSLEVWISKEGYYASHRDQKGFSYGWLEGFKADPLNPVVFHLRKKGKSESLIEKNFPPGIGQIWQLHHDGTPIELDLLNGSQNVTGIGQLKLEFWRDTSNLNKQPFDWKLQLSMLGGGLVPTDEEFAFQAPESGYQPSIVIDMPATNQDWLGELRTKYYVQLPNGNYGHFDFYLLPRNGVFTVQSTINPTGSQNLEPQ